MYSVKVKIVREARPKKDGKKYANGELPQAREIGSQISLVKRLVNPVSVVVDLAISKRCACDSL